MKRPSQANTSIYLPSELKDKLKKRSEEHGVSITKQIQKAIKAYLKTKKY